MAKKLIPHINAILHPSQHGFQQGLSCTTQLLEVLQNIGLKLDKGHETDIIYLDFAKALTQYATVGYGGNSSTMVFRAPY